LKRKDCSSLNCAHNPKVGGSNPSPAISYGFYQSVFGPKTKLS
jgi:hypothetical protein